MRKTVLTFLFLVIVLSTSFGMANYGVVFAADSGAGDVLEIFTAGDLCKITNEENLNKNFILKNDIDLETDISWHLYLPDFDPENGFLPIDAIDNFGIFDGNGYIIKNLYINRPNTEKVGLFSDSNLVIQNLKVEYSKGLPFGLTGGESVGGLVANNYRTISHCSVKADIKASGFAGGLACANSGDIRNSFFEGSIHAMSAGGLTFECNYGSIDNCYSAGEIYAEFAGGFIGAAMGSEIYNSFSYIDMFGVEEGNGYFGSFIGDARIEDVAINNCYTLFLDGIPAIRQGDPFAEVRLLEKAGFLRQDEFNLDFENIWYYDKIAAAYPLIRNIYVSLQIKNSTLKEDDFLTRNYYHAGEKFEISLLNYPGKEFSFIVINGQDKTGEIKDKKLEQIVDGRMQIDIKLEYLLQLRVNSKNPNEIVIEKEFYKNGEKISVEIKNRPLRQVKRVFGNIQEENISFKKTDKNTYEFLINMEIKEDMSLSVSASYSNYLLIVIIIPAVILLLGALMAIIVIVRRKGNEDREVV